MPSANLPSTVVFGCVAALSALVTYTALSAMQAAPPATTGLYAPVVASRPLARAMQVGGMRLRAGADDFEPEVPAYNGARALDLADGVLDGMYYGSPVRGENVAVETVDMEALKGTRNLNNTSDDIGPYLPLFGFATLALVWGLSKLFGVLKTKAGELGVEINPGEVTMTPPDRAYMSYKPTIQPSGDPLADAMEDELAAEIRRRGIGGQNK